MQEKKIWVIYRICKSSEGACRVCCLALGQEPACSPLSLKLESTSGSYDFLLEQRQRNPAAAPCPVRAILLYRTAKACGILLL